MNSIDKNAFKDVINQLRVWESQKTTYTVYTYREPREDEKDIFKHFGLEYQVIPSTFMLSDDDLDTIYIVPNNYIMKDKPLKIVFQED